ncbi:hypothetical protein BDV97DRAFT_42845 [Delphinella strobiligena]|nr:hypothetical protein BDV97DRAFT_42845 [Delphinella strobiligena]
MLKSTSVKAATKHTHHSHPTNYSKTYQHVPSLHIPLLDTSASPNASSPQCLVPYKPSPTRSTPDFATASSTTKIAAKATSAKTVPGSNDSKVGTTLCLAGATRNRESGVLKIDPRQSETWRGTYCLTGSRWIWERKSGSDGQQVSSWREVVDG